MPAPGRERKQGQKKPRREAGLYTGYCCCREFGFWLSSALVFFLLFYSALGSSSACRSSSCLCASSGFDVWLQMSNWQPLVETFLVRKL
jgi:hypothetical protein